MGQGQSVRDQRDEDIASAGEATASERTGAAVQPAGNGAEQDQLRAQTCGQENDPVYQRSGALGAAFHEYEQVPEGELSAAPISSGHAEYDEAREQDAFARLRALGVTAEVTGPGEYRIAGNQGQSLSLDALMEAVSCMEATAANGMSGDEIRDFIESYFAWIDENFVYYPYLEATRGPIRRSGEAPPEPSQEAWATQAYADAAERSSGFVDAAAFAMAVGCVLMTGGYTAFFLGVGAGGGAAVGAGFEIVSGGAMTVFRTVTTALAGWNLFVGAENLEADHTRELHRFALRSDTYADFVSQYGQLPSADIRTGLLEWMRGQLAG